MHPVRIFDTKYSLARNFAGYFADWVNQKSDSKPFLYIGLSGGNTPQLWFQELADHYAKKIDWKRLHFFWIDERYVPHSNKESNFGTACHLLFDRIPIPKDHLHPVHITGNVEHDTLNYNSEIKHFVPHRFGWPVFDLVTLGMGADGHVASIFNGQLNLFHVNTPVCSSCNPHNHQQRITLSGPVINHAEERFFLIAGNDKTNVLKDIFLRKSGYEQYPVSQVVKGNTLWFLDTEAAKGLPEPV